MRIISGKFKGKIIHAPKSLPVRPTTDFAKTGLFNILRSRYNFSELKFLDLFCGTGNISFEMISQGVRSVTAIDFNTGCIKFVNKVFCELNFKEGKAIKADVFKFILNVNEKYDIIFADPPYNLKESEKLSGLIFENNLLNKDGIFILEHQSKIDYSSYDNFIEKRVYGNVGFSFFGKNKFL